MTEKLTKRDRRDWTLIVLLLPIGIIFMLIAGQIAIRLVPSWRVNAGMDSSLDPETASGGGGLFFQPILFDILTPMDWLDTFLTPGPDSVDDELSFAPFIVFDPSSTPSPSASPTISNTPPPPTDTPTATQPPPPTATWTKEPPEDDGEEPPPPPPSASPAPPPGSAPLVGIEESVPPEIAGPPDGQTDGSNVGTVHDGHYIILNLPSPIIVVGTSDTSFDFVFYERPVGGGGIDMDGVILSISTAELGAYYVVFNWGDGTADTNSNLNINTIGGSETDNRHIDPPVLYGSGTQDTGVLVDVDNAPSHPPADNYSWLAIQAPLAPPVDGNDGADVDAIEVIEVPSPWP